MAPPRSTAPHRVVVLALDGVIPFELGIPAAIFGGAEGPAGEPLYEVIVCTLDGRPVRSDAGFAIAVEHDASALERADTFVLAPTQRLGAMREGGPPPPGLAAAFTRLRPGTRVASICTASYILAAAGLLDDRPATTHWRDAPHFQRTFPRVRVDRDVLFVDAGTILTSAGAAAGVDLCLHLVRRDHGSGVANQVARRCVVPPWRDGGQAQYVERPVPGPESNGTAATRAWALEQLGRPITLSELAAHAGMSVRSFSRHFQAEVGIPPGQWLTAQRIELARELLESSDLSVDRVADRAGFGTGNSLRQHMRAALGISPSAYRRTFGAGAGAG
ncbi:GlxA family transcriptional regulator [Streptomyces specialis]|uniref:GlxA family transcriptional regulator n=1 Tax=Streptomyces specialis TaxID=498367 RepID=UPI00073F16C3|nr:helix-turn-helix domain-containing protein [Streptomyces specialis]